MLTRDDLARIARRHGLGLGRAEHEYVILCVLDGLGRTPLLAEHLVFKGGTALRQLYFPDWRYSEDLDFSALPGLDTGRLSEQIAIQPIQINQQRTVVLGEGAGRVGETGTGKEGIVHRPSLTDGVS